MIGLSERSRGNRSTNILLLLALPLLLAACGNSAGKGDLASSSLDASSMNTTSTNTTSTGTSSEEAGAAKASNSSSAATSSGKVGANKDKAGSSINSVNSTQITKVTVEGTPTVREVTAIETLAELNNLR